ncbi:hypothetical protein [Polaribacter porphyrae]|uniref:Uncharacterized protein n=1 Tax=Polaribacter porphyrae TaxID=1137780 RepID=A0A2S7WQY3_9FLAO|nr:hypothetical protein [Polaribacter porphyrae]PQJ79681.1 hypothetical protein BTO18_11075 [Polaribacter porphyrae]
MIKEKEEKFSAVFESLQEKPNEINMFGGFLKMYPAEWKQLKITFSKFNRSKQFGRTIPLPKPEQSLKKEIRVWLKSRNNG